MSDDDISEILTGDIDYEPSSDNGSSDSDKNDFGPGKSTDNDLSWSATLTQYPYLNFDQTKVGPTDSDFLPIFH